ncbi:MAG TPA: CBS domain-containing protein [Microbacteriaceae bacterium]
MTTTTQGTPSGTDAARVIYLSTLLKHAVIDAHGQGIGRLADVIVRLQPSGYPTLTGLVARVGSNTVFVPISDVIEIDADRIELRTARLDLRLFERRSGEVLLKQDVLGHRLIEVDRATLVHAYDVVLRPGAIGWLATGFDVHKTSRFQRSDPTLRDLRDWGSFEPLIGHEPSGRVRSGFGRLRALRPAQIADLIEEGSPEERDDLLDHLQHDPELEADVFEELDDDRQTQLLKSRNFDDIVRIVSLMRSDDAADAIGDLPQELRQQVMAVLDEPQRSAVLRLMRYQDATAGGLMGLDFVAVNEATTVGVALDRMANASAQQPEALTTIFSVDEQGRLVGALGIVRALQADRSALLRELTAPNPVHATPADDVIDVTTQMADFNLLTLPVLDDDGRILGVITVDDALEAAIPEDWRRRERQPHPTGRVDAGLDQTLAPSVRPDPAESGEGSVS